MRTSDALVVTALAWLYCAQHSVRGNEGKSGHGIAVLVAPSCSDYVRVLFSSENVQCIWMQCDKKMFGLEEDVIVGAAYITPQSRDLFLSSSTFLREQFLH